MKLSPRYHDVKMNITYTLEDLRAEHMMLMKSDPFKKVQSFEDWIHDMVENEVLIPIN